MSRGSRQEGFALLAVILVMVALGIIAAYLAEAISGRHAATSLGMLQRRADHAAGAGLEWARARALVGGACANAQVTYAGLTVDIACVTQQVDEDGVLVDVFEVTADARHGSYGNADFTRRLRRARFSNR